MKKLAEMETKRLAETETKRLAEMETKRLAEKQANQLPAEEVKQLFDCKIEDLAQGRFLPSMPDFLQGPRAGSMMIRDVYPQLYDEFIARDKTCQDALRQHKGPMPPPGYARVLLKGTPGIGKSCFGAYCVWRLVHEHQPRTVVYYRTTNKIAHVIDPKGKTIVLQENPELISIPGAVYIIDTGGHNAESAPDNFRSTQLCVSSPDDDQFKNYVKAGAAVWHLPPFELDEYRNLAIALKVPVAVAEERFKRYGGAARLLPEDNQSLRREADDAMTDGRLCKTALEAASGQFDNHGSALFHKIIYYMPHKDPATNIYDCTNSTTVKLVFASAIVEQSALKTVTEAAELDLFKLIDTYRGRPMASVLRGYVFEFCAHRALTRGGAWPIKFLGTCNAQGKPVSGSTQPAQFQCAQLTINANQQLVVPSSQVGPALDTLGDCISLTPGSFAYFKKSNMSAVDAVFAPNSFVQITVSNNHGITRSGLVAIRKLKISRRTVTEMDLIFVVPRDTNMQLQTISAGSDPVPVVHQWQLELTMT